jgi:acetyl esterase/lipase
MSEARTYPAPPFDPELAVSLSALAEFLPPSLTPDMIPAMRAPLPFDVPVDETIAAAGVVRRDATIAGYGGDEIEVTVLHREDHVASTPAPGIYHTHGGGMIIGDRFTGLAQLLPWVAELGAVAVTVEYRLAPEFPDPYPVEDCYAGLLWTAAHAGELGIDLDRLVIAGASAGGGLAAGTALMARDRQGPRLTGQCLIYPMLDDRDATVSTRQIDKIGVWDRTSNITGWSALLGDRRGTDDVSIYAAPARATDLSGLPPTYIDCGTAEVFRDEDVAYASALWAHGVQAELHVFPGGFHGFDLMNPEAQVSKAMTTSRTAWMRHALS